MSLDQGRGVVKYRVRFYILDGYARKDISNSGAGYEIPEEYDCNHATQMYCSEDGREV